MNKACYWQGLAILGLFGLVGLIMVWNIWFSHPQFLPRSIEFAIFLLPLAFLTKGLLAGTTATHAYASFSALFYILFGFWFVLTPSEEIYGAGMLLFGFFLYLGSFMYARLTMTKIPKETSSS